jgi:DNA-binding CsgD family transcriptional regulator
LKISDLLTPAEWQRTELFNEFFRPLGITHQLALMFPIGTIQVGFAANRERRDFSDSERFLLSLLQPHFLQAYLNAQAMERVARAADAQGGGTVVLAADASVLFCSPKARKSLKRFFGPLPKKRLPDELRRWVERGLAARSFDPAATRPLIPLTKRNENSILTVRLCANFALGEHVLIVDEQPVEVPLEVFEQFGHSRRESEVLSWIAQGKTNPEIAIILNISPRTVAHHVERILARIGVEGRGSAGAWAQETIRVHRIHWAGGGDGLVASDRR